MTRQPLDRLTCKQATIPDRWGGHTTVYAVQPTGLKDAIQVLIGRYDARIWTEKYGADG